MLIYLKKNNFFLKIIMMIKINFFWKWFNFYETYLNLLNTKYISFLFKKPKKNLKNITIDEENYISLGN